MSEINFALNAEVRKNVGKGASRRLRRTSQLIPAIVYGAHQDPESISIYGNELYKVIQHESFYSHIIKLNIAGKEEDVVLKDIQRHPFKPTVIHMDFQRVSNTEKIQMRIPLHFINESKAPGVKKQGGIISHILTDISVSCLPKDLPEFIEVDLIDLQKDQTIHLSDLKLPKGVELTVQVDDAHDSPVVSIHSPKANTTEETDNADSTDEAEKE